MIFSHTEAVGKFVLDVLSAFVGIPSEVARWWRDGHTRTAWLRSGDPTNALRGRAAEQDYMRWRMLGKVSDVLLLAILLTIGILIGLAF